jgi:hypothetical protein
MGSRATSPSAPPDVPAAVVAALRPWVVSGLRTPCVYYDHAFLPAAEAQALYTELLQGLSWETNSQINRMTALHGDLSGTDESDYHYKDAPSLEVRGPHPHSCHAWSGAPPTGAVSAVASRWLR